MTVLFVQTAEPSHAPFLDQTSRTVREYCRRHGFNFQSFHRIVRGVHRWHAIYSRILLLRHLVEAGHREG